MQNRASFRRMQRSRWSQSVTFSSGNLGEMVQPGIPTFTMFSEISFLFFLLLNVLRCQCFLKFLFFLFILFLLFTIPKLVKIPNFSKVLHPTFLFVLWNSSFFQCSSSHFSNVLRNKGEVAALCRPAHWVSLQRRKNFVFRSAILTKDNWWPRIWK